MFSTTEVAHPFLLNLKLRNRLPCMSVKHRVEKNKNQST